MGINIYVFKIILYFHRYTKLNTKLNKIRNKEAIQ